MGSQIILSENWSFLPSMFFSYVRAAPTDYMLSAAFGFQQLIELGLLYTRGGGVGGTTFLNLNHGFQLGYSYVTSAVDQITRFSKGTHEFILKFTFKGTSTEVPEEAILNTQILERDNTINRLKY